MFFSHVNLKFINFIFLTDKRRMKSLSPEFDGHS